MSSICPVGFGSLLQEICGMFTVSVEAGDASKTST